MSDLIGQQHRFVLLTQCEAEDSTPGRYAPYLTDARLLAWHTLNRDTSHPPVSTPRTHT